MRPLSGEEETSTPVQKPTKDKKRKRTSSSEDPKPKNNLVRKPKKDTVALPADVIQRLRKEEEEEEEEDEDDGSELVARVKKTTEAPKAAESVLVEEISPIAEGVLEKGSGKVPESSKIKDASRRDEKKEGFGTPSGGIFKVPSRAEPM
nr:PHD finger protein 23-like [Nicotiana tomentosiformis]